MPVHLVVAAEPVARAQRRGLGKAFRRRVQFSWTYSSNLDRQLPAGFAPSMADQPAFVQSVCGDVREHRDQQVCMTLEKSAQRFLRISAVVWRRVCVFSSSESGDTSHSVRRLRPARFGNLCERLRPIVRLVSDWELGPQGTVKTQLLS